MISDDLRIFQVDGFMDAKLSLLSAAHLLRKTRRRIEEMRQETCPDHCEEKMAHSKLTHSNGGISL